MQRYKHATDPGQGTWITSLFAPSGSASCRNIEPALQAYLAWGKPEVRHGFVTDTVEKDGLISMAYPLGEWFFPCLWDAITCHADMNERKKNLDFPEHLAGHHYSVVSWFKELGERI